MTRALLRSLATAQIVVVLAAGAALARECEDGAGKPRAYDVGWQAPVGQPVSGVRLRLSYPREELSLPEAPAKRFAKLPANANLDVDDTGDALNVLVSRSGALPGGRLFSVEFDGCKGAAKAEVVCTVLECASSFGPVQGCTCNVAPAP